MALTRHSCLPLKDEKYLLPIVDVFYGYFKGGYSNCSHLTELEKIYVTESYMKKKIVHISPN